MTALRNCDLSNSDCWLIVLSDRFALVSTCSTFGYNESLAVLLIALESSLEDGTNGTDGSDPEEDFRWLESVSGEWGWTSVDLGTVTDDSVRISWWTGLDSGTMSGIGGGSSVIGEIGADSGFILSILLGESSCWNEGRCISTRFGGSCMFRTAAIWACVGTAGIIGSLSAELVLALALKLPDDKFTEETRFGVMGKLGVGGGDVAVGDGMSYPTAWANPLISATCALRSCGWHW